MIKIATSPEELKCVAKYLEEKRNEAQKIGEAYDRSQTIKWASENQWACGPMPEKKKDVNVPKCKSKLFRLFQ